MDTERAIEPILTIQVKEYTKEAEPNSTLPAIPQKNSSLPLCEHLLKKYGAYSSKKEGFAPYLIKRLLCSYRKNFWI